MELPKMSWPRKPPAEVFIRFGRWASNDPRSRNFSTWERERGLSVYEAKLVNGAVELVAPDEVQEAVFGRLAFAVTGKRVAAGSDGEPVLINVRALSYPIGWQRMPECVRKSNL